MISLQTRLNRGLILVFVSGWVLAAMPSAAWWSTK